MSLIQVRQLWDVNAGMHQVGTVCFDSLIQTIEWLGVQRTFKVT